MKPRLWLLLLAEVGLGQAPEVVFKAEARLVEVYVNVTDGRGRPVVDLTRERFQVMEEGQAQELVVFEAGASDLNCAILLDTTGSMGPALPVVKNAILRLVDQLRADDWAAVYGFSTKVTALQDFTRDREAAKRAVLGARALGSTALFDAISQVARMVARRSGKKVIVAFTDGKDNSSVLSAAAALTRAKKIGVPVYTVAQGEALQSRPLLAQLRDIAKRTGGLSFEARNADDVERVFNAIAREIQHTYMLAYKPPPASGSQWRAIQVTIHGLKDYKLRAKEGYVPE